MLSRQIYDYCLDRFSLDFPDKKAGYNSIYFVSECGSFSVTNNTDDVFNICVLKMDDNAILQTVKEYAYVNNLQIVNDVLENIYKIIYTNIFKKHLT